MRTAIYIAILFFVVSVTSLAMAEPEKETPATAEAASQGEEEIEEVEVASVAPEDTWFGEGYSRVDKAVALMNASTTRKGNLVFTIDHRTFQPLKENTFHDFFGLDAGGLKIGLGLRYGILGNFDAGIYRLNNATLAFDTYEFDLKYRLLNQSKHFIDLALRPGFTWFSQDNAEDSSGFFGQLIMSKLFFKRLNFSALLLYHSNSSNEFKSDQDTKYTMGAGASLEYRIFSFLALDLESAYGFLGYNAKTPDTSAAVKFITNRHTFSILVTNHQFTTADGIITNTERKWKDLICGFSLTREF